MKFSIALLFVLISTSFAAPTNVANELDDVALRNIFQQLGDAISGAIVGIGNQVVQDLALQITQQLADFANGGSLFGKRSTDEKLDEAALRNIFQQLGDAISGAIVGIGNQVVQDLALQITQQLADFANGGSLFGKRLADVKASNIWADLFGGSISTISETISESLQNTLNQGVQDLALQITQQLADFANGGSLFGKRSIDEKASNIWSDWIDAALKPAIDNTAQGLAGLLAQITAGIAIGGIPAITDLVGKRSIDEKASNIWSDWIDAALKPAIDNTAQGLAGLLAQITAGIAIGGIPAITDLIG